MSNNEFQEPVVLPHPAASPDGSNGLPVGSLPGVTHVEVVGDEVLVDQWEPTHCKKCQTVVVPEGRGQCPTCARFLKGNRSTQKHPVRASRREVLRRQIEAEYRPSTMLARETCKHLAATLERLEVLKPGAPEWARLVGVVQTLGNALREAQSETPTSTAALDLSSLSTADLAERASFVAERLLDLALAEKAGREDVTRAATANRTQQQAAIVERQTAALVEAAETGAPVQPLPDWFSAWLEKQHGTPVDESAPARGQAWTTAWVNTQRGRS